MRTWSPGNLGAATLSTLAVPRGYLSGQAPRQLHSPRLCFGLFGVQGTADSRTPRRLSEGGRGWVPWRGEAPGPPAHPAPPAPPLPLLSLRPKLCLPRRLPLGGRPAMYQRMLRCGAELGSPGGGSSGGGGAGGRLALLWIVPLTLSGLLGVAWGASSLGAHHIHHFHGSSKHHTVPIAIYRSPASLRGGHGGSAMPSSCGLPPRFPPSTLHSLLGP